MVHPWITAHGTWPLVPYTEQVVDGELIDKVLLVEQERRGARVAQY